MAAKTKRDDALRVASSRSAMMNHDRPLTAFLRSATRDAASVSIPREHFFRMAAEVLLILPPQRAAGRAEAESEDLIPATRTTDRALEKTSHSDHITQSSVATTTRITSLPHSPLPIYSLATLDQSLGSRR